MWMVRGNKSNMNKVLLSNDSHNYSAVQRQLKHWVTVVKTIVNKNCPTTDKKLHNCSLQIAIFSQKSHTSLTKRIVIKIPRANAKSTDLNDKRVPREMRKLIVNKRYRCLSKS